MERRSFLKLIGFVGGAAATGVSLSADAERMSAYWKVSEVGAPSKPIRIVGAYDVSRDEEMWRCDILLKNDDQLTIDAAWKGGPAEEDIEMVRGIFSNEIQHRGFTWADVRQLPLPANNVLKAFHV